MIKTIGNYYSIHSTWEAIIGDRLNVASNKIDEIIDYLNPSVIWEVEDGAQKPTKAHDTDVGFDLYSKEDAVIRPGETVKVKTGVKAQPSPGYFFLVRDRSSMGSKGIIVTSGVIDNAYRGELIVCLCNANQGGEDYTYTISKGDKIAQMILLPSYVVSETVGKVSQSDRGEKGFGSSGR